MMSRVAAIFDVRVSSLIGWLRLAQTGSDWLRLAYAGMVFWGPQMIYMTFDYRVWASHSSLH
eukprot:scaffold137846_cov22-Prasinocladus_malaysianus.AAC.1